jgi:hypothetical protein
MACRSILKVVLVVLLVGLFILPVQTSAQLRSRRDELDGDWLIKMKFGKTEFESILAFSRNQEDQYTGQWLSFFGMMELTDVKLEENKLSFTLTVRSRGEEGTSKFTGAIKQGEISGLLVSDGGETEIKGKRSPQPPRGVGSWVMKIKVGDREYMGTLTITADKEGNLLGTWKSSRGESKVSDVKYESRRLTFKRVVQRDSGQMEMTFEGTIGYASLEGVFKSDRGESTVTGTRVGASVIGMWNLDIESEQGSRKQRLRVNSDMSALLGSHPVKKINLDGDKVSFEYIVKVGDRELETSFEGKISDSKLTGEIKTSRGGTSKVTGAKLTYGRHRSSGR